MKVVFRADASVRIGTGHVMRCLTLADELRRQGHECSFVCRNQEGHMGAVIQDKGYRVNLLSAPLEESNPSPIGAYEEWLGVSWQEDARQTLNVTSELNAEWLIADHYALDARWERAVSVAFKNIMVLDDLANRPHDCSLLLDQNLGRTDSDYIDLTPSHCHRLIGPRYALLRPEFEALREASLAHRQHPSLSRILISLGGIDRTNVTGKVLETLSGMDLGADLRLDIVMGASAPCLDDVRQRAKQLPFDVSVSVNVKDMAERMGAADLSIGAAGGTSWERCCLGLPAVLIILADNQKDGARALEHSGAAIVIRDPADISAVLPGMIARFADAEVLQKFSHDAAAITDGKGVARVAESLVNRSRSL